MKATKPYVKEKTGDSTTEAVYAGWYAEVYLPELIERWGMNVQTDVSTKKTSSDRA